ncbi:nucleoporin nup211-like isoform X1 [Acyrthosiphon pisum]|uniref:RING-type domain-containing protein n=1 Tax=Acyrthosiphon pisum TaxID=7029 RepID=A0A8R2NX47_ACYPI|nr:nucleoporin nup211-like isoform X1 [Acyrthosiphon pisum]
MLPSCSICDDYFTGLHPESVHTTRCGHVFHYECLMTWIQRSQTCPHCRSKVTKKKTIKLYFHKNSNLSIKEDISSLTDQVQSLTYENTLKKDEIKKLLTITKKDKEQLDSFKKQFKDMKDIIQGHQTFVSALEENISFLKSKCKKSICYKLEAEELRKYLVKYQSVKEDISSLTDQVQSLTYENTLKKEEIKKLLTITKKDKEQLDSLKKQFKDMKDIIQGHQTFVSALEENISFLKSECKKSICYKLEAEELRKDLVKYQFIKEDISSLTDQVQSLTYEITLKKEEIKKLLTITKKDKEQLDSLKKQFKDMKDIIQGHQTFVSALEENISFLKSECKKSICYKLEAEELRKDLVKYQSINSILYGTAADSQEAVSLLKKKTDVETLCLLITSFKKEIQTLKESNRDLETKFSQCVTKYMELKRHILCNENSKQSVNTQVVEKLESGITDFEAEIERLQKKCENLKSLVQANDDTPRRTELRKRIIYENPALDLSITPSLEKGLKTVINSPENSVSSMEQPKGQLKPQSLNNKREQSSSQCVNTFMPKSPRRPIGFVRPPLTTKSVSANNISKSMVYSSSSDEEMYEGLARRSKPDVYPSRQKPVTRKRKYDEN